MVSTAALRGEQSAPQPQPSRSLLATPDSLTRRVSKPIMCSMNADEAIRGQRSSKTGGSRSISDEERLMTWVRSGGCCALCGKYLLEGEITGRAMTLGELAHIIGQQNTASSPRGLADMSDEDRDKADNLMLACEDEHEEIDRRRTQDLTTVAWLNEVKQAHEAWIRQLVTLQRDRRTAIVRMVGTVRGATVELTNETAGTAVVRNDARYPDFPLSYGTHGIEIDLRNLPGEATGTAMYWQAARAAIDEVIDHKLKAAVGREDVRHLSVFAFARLPLLVYLGSKIDDTFEVSIFQRHRHDESWDWSDGQPVAFAVEAAGNLAEEAVLILNVSGTISAGEIPEAVAGLPRYVLSPIATAPDKDLITSRETLVAFAIELRRLLSSLEVPAKTVRRLHVLAALPLSAAVALGRVHHAGVNPNLVLYDRADGRYAPVLEIT